MTYESFVDAVQRGAHIPSDEAERAACATLQTLSERISGGEAHDIAERLPDRLRSCVEPARQPDAFAVEEFLRRVGERAHVDGDAARRDARAVISALFRVVGPEEFHDLRSELPSDFDPLLDAALRDSSTLVPGDTEPRPGMTVDEFVGRVADRADVDPERARRAAAAVLEVLGMRLSAGAAEDLAVRLAPELRVAVETGITKGGEKPRAMDADDFLRSITRRLNVTMDEATDAVRAVLTTLREAVGEQEFREAVAQLPGDYAPLLRHQG